MCRDTRHGLRSHGHDVDLKPLGAKCGVGTCLKPAGPMLRTRSRFRHSVLNYILQFLASVLVNADVCRTATFSAQWYDHITELR